MEARLTELESKLAFAEDLLDALNQTVTRQQAGRYEAVFLADVGQLTDPLPDEDSM